MEHSLVKNLILVGASGVGKTMLVRDVTLARREKVGGFYTEPVRMGRIRKGFMMRTLDGQDRMLASRGLKSPHKMDGFGVDLNALENVGIPALKLALMSKDLIVIDEIGCLEAMSERFRLTLLECLHSTKPILATMRAGSHPFCEEVKKFPNSRTLVLTKSNYASIKQQVRKWIETQL